MDSTTLWFFVVPGYFCFLVLMVALVFGNDIYRLWIRKNAAQRVERERVLSDLAVEKEDPVALRENAIVQHVDVVFEPASPTEERELVHH